MVAFRADEAYLSSPDAVVDPMLFALSRCYDRSLLRNGFLPWWWMLDAKPTRTPPLGAAESHLAERPHHTGLPYCALAGGVWACHDPDAP